MNTRGAGGFGQARRIAREPEYGLVDDQASAILGEKAQFICRDAWVGLMRVGGCLVRAVVDLPAVLRRDLGVAVARGAGRHDVEQDMLVEHDRADAGRVDIAENRAHHAHA